MPKKQNKSLKPKRKNSGRWTPMIIIALLTMVFGVYLLARYADKIFPPIAPQKIDIAKTKAVSLYFSDKKGVRLTAEKRDIKKDAVINEIREVVEELIKGPSEKFIPTIPDGTKVLNVTVKNDTAFVDFSPDISTKHPGGSSSEIQTIYSIVNTITSNFPEIKKVQMLINGKKEKTLAGHIDISLPLAGDLKK